MNTKSRDDYDASMRLVESNVDRYWAGDRDCYRVVAVQLRILLCDRKPLLPRVIPDATLHILHWTELLQGCPSLMEGLTTIMPGELRTDTNGSSRFELLFGKSGHELSVSEWIKQPFFSLQTTVEEIIKSVADKEGAHSDPRYNTTLSSAKQISYGGTESHCHGIVAIGEYLVRRFSA